MRCHIRPLDHTADSANFDCGESALNAYLQRYATQDIKRGVARAFVATPIHPDQTDQPDQPDAVGSFRCAVAGFYTLSAASVAAETLPEAWRKKLPRYPVPAALLGRLAVAQSAQGQGLGSILLADACQRVAAVSQTLAVVAIMVDAQSPQAAAFYQHFGFVQLPGQSSRWMLPRSHFASLA